MTVVDVLAHEYGWSDQTILNLTVAKARAYIDAVNHRLRGEFRKSIALTEWSTRLLALTTAASAGGSGEMQRTIAKERFPWFEDEEESQEGESSGPVDENDLSFLETGDTGAAEKNAGKTLPFVPQ